MLIKSATPLVLLIVAAGAGEAFDFESRSLNRCGPLALQVCARFVGSEVPGEELSKLLRCNGEDGCSLAAIEQAARAAGLCTAAIRWEADFPTVTESPAIIRIMLPNHRSHFVSAVGTAGERVLLVDVPRKPHWVTNGELRHRLGWDGYAVHVAKNSQSLEEVGRAMRAPWRPATFASAACFTLVGLACLAVCMTSAWRQTISAPRHEARTEP